MLGIYFSPKPPTKPELKDLVFAANEVAKTARDVLTAMLVVALTLAATMIAATDEALLRDSAEVFPGLGAKVRLSTVFLLAPMVFAFLHANALLQLHLLAGRVRALDEEMKAQGLDETARKPWRRMIHGFAFAQLLAGDDSHGGGFGEGLHRVLLAFVSWLAIVVVPVGLLVCAQVSFVRYQSDIITLVHQGIIALDLALLLWFHSASWGRVTNRRLASASWSLLTLAAVAAIVWLCATQALPPGPENNPYAIRRDGGDPPATLSDLTCRWPGMGWTCRYLDLSNRTLVDNDAKPDLLKPFAEDGNLKTAQRKMVALDLQGRNLRFADFTGAQLFSADLRKIQAEKSTWVGATLQGATLYEARLQGATLSEASLQGATLFRASLQGANLFGASLQGANLFEASLLGATLFGASLQGANLSRANLQGATLSEANLLGANLDEANLQSANLDEANLQSANLRGASLQWTTGRLLGCENALWTDVDTSPLSLDDLAAQLKAGGLDEDRITRIRRRIEKGPATDCNGKPLGQPPSPAADDFAKARLQAACTHAAAASRIREPGLPSPYDDAFKKAWDAETCPAVMAVKREWGEVR